MTTGTRSIVGGYPAKSESLYKNWGGADGKYEVWFGGIRCKWNNYTCTFQWESPQFGQQTAAVTASAFSGGVPFTALDNVKLQSKLVERIKGHQFNLAVDLAQGKQLVTMCSKTILMFGRTLRYLKHGDIAAAARELGVSGKNRPVKGKDISSRWLEMQYGWMPAISSCFEAAKAFEALSMGRSNRVAATVTKGRSYNGSAAPSLYTSMGYQYTRKRIICELFEEISFARSLGLTDPLQVAWELLPYSFVFDWFLPIGSYLENLSVIPTLKARYCTTTTYADDAGFTAPTGVPASLIYTGSKRTFRRRYTERVVTTTLPVAFPSFVGVSSAMSPQHIKNAVALAHQLIA